MASIGLLIALLSKRLAKKCGHVFHEKCIAPWIIKEKNCPTCREKVILPITVIDIITDISQGVERVFRGFFLFALVACVFLVAVEILNFISPGAWPEPKKEDMWDLNDLKNCYKLMLTMKAIAGISSFYLLVKLNNYVKNQQALASITRINYRPQVQ